MQVLHDAAQVPVRIELVGGLVVGHGLVVGLDLAAILLALFNVVDAALGVERRHAVLGEAEVVGAEEEALLDAVLFNQGAALGLGDRAQHVVELAVAQADDHEVLGRTDHGHRVQVHHRHRVLERDHRVGGVILRTQQARLFQRHQQEHHRTRRLRVLHGEGLGDLQHAGDAGGVVDGAVVDVVFAFGAGRHRIAVTAVGGAVVAQVVPVRGVDDGFVRTLGARQFGQDVAGTAFVDGRIQRGAEGGVTQVHGLEAGLVGGGALLRQVQAGVGEQLLGHFAGDPALHRQARLGVVGNGQVVLRARPAVLHHVPAVTGAGIVMDDERGGGALAGGFFVLVGPAAVVGHLLAAEEIGAVDVEARVVDQHDHGLALHVQAFVVVPAGFGRVHAVTHEHHFAGIDGNFRLGGAGAQGHLRAEGQRAVFTTQGDLRAGGGFVGGGLHHRHVLEPAVAVARLQAQALELRDQVVGGHLLAGGARGAAAELIGGQHLHVRREVFGGDLGAEAVVGRRRAGRGRGGGAGLVRRFRRRTAGRQGQRRGGKKQGVFHAWGLQLNGNPDSSAIPGIV